MVDGNMNIHVDQVNLTKRFAVNIWRSFQVKHVYEYIYQYYLEYSNSSVHFKGNDGFVNVKSLVCV